MEVKSFSAYSMKDALKAVKEQFGRDAVILQTKEKVDPANASSKMYEIVAAASRTIGLPGGLARMELRSGESGGSSVLTALEGFDVKLDKIIDQTKQNRQLDMIESSLHELRALLGESIYSRSRQGESSTPEHLQKIEAQLLLMGIDEETIVSLLKFLSEVAGPEDNQRKIPESEEEYYRHQAIRWMIKRIKIAPRWSLSSGATAVHAIAGGTGVGKTTMVAKLASHYHLREKTKVLVLSMDSKKIAAAEQLRIYSQIIGVSFAKVDGIEDISGCIDAHPGSELVLIDTAGRSVKSDQALVDLEDMKTLPFPIDLHLLLSVTEKEEQHHRAVRCFSPIGIQSLMFTKLDQAWSYGEIFNVSKKWSLPLSFFSIGSRTPEDLERASRERVVERIFGL